MIKVDSQLEEAHAHQSLIIMQDQDGLIVNKMLEGLKIVY